ncbi:hypothetical protein CEXT_6091 [Caerostris extrusa]|uniref:Uncharacterized protein n=1 Tax=Caerostris extrusa TaxID=172846 RepID=A0AAV4VEG7_CAEEX|nr:hypothetical protein CEXT_6091 [Caerostris extrusa]
MCKAFYVHTVVRFAVVVSSEVNILSTIVVDIACIIGVSIHSIIVDVVVESSFHLVIVDSIFQCAYGSFNSSCTCVIFSMYKAFYIPSVVQFIVVVTSGVSIHSTVVDVVVDDYFYNLVVLDSFS